MTFCSFFSGPFRKLVEILPDRLAVPLLFLRRFKRLPNLKNPQTFNEKIAWRKLYQHDPRFTLLADKIAVKVEIAKLVGPQHVIPTLWSGDNPEDIPFDTLPLPYVIKVSHGWGSNIFVKKQEDVQREKIIQTLRDNLSHDHGYKLREWGYYNIPKKILVEPMLQDENQQPPADYKVFIFHGRAHYTQVNYDRFTGISGAYYDRDWHQIDCVMCGYPPTNRDPTSLARRERMIALAEKIGADFDFVRVDLYDTEPDILFGEMTFYPSGGLGHFIPYCWDEEFGKLWHIQPQPKNAP